MKKECCFGMCSVKSSMELWCSKGAMTAAVLLAMRMDAALPVMVLSVPSL